MTQIHTPPSTEESIPLPKSGTYLRPNQERAMADEVDSIQKTLDDPHATVQNRPMLQTRLRTLKHSLESQRPPDLTPAQRDAASRRLAVLEQEISEAMVTQEEHRRAPPDALRKQIRYNRTMTPKVLEAKNLLLMLHKGSQEEDIANLERLRKRGTPFNPDNVLIQGKTFVGVEKSPAYEQGWERVFGEQQSKIGDLQAKIEELLILVEQDKGETSVPVVEEKPFMLECNGCGMVVRGKTEGTTRNGLRAHQRACSGCKKDEPLPAA